MFHLDQNPPMTTLSFWFMVCANYFPKGKRSKLTDALKQVREDKQVSISTIIQPIFMHYIKQRKSNAVDV